MPFQTKYIYSAAMDVGPEKEALFNEVYGKEYIPLLLKVPGVVAAARFKKQEVTLIIDGVRKTIVVENEPTYNTLYEIESPEVLLSDGWVNASHQTRFAEHVRPFTKNRRQVLYKKLA